MSLMDQAISHGAGETSADQVRAMLGLADRARVLDLFDLVMRGEAAGALTALGAQYADGADPMAVLRDLAEISHWLSVIKVAPDAADDPTVPPDERDRGREMAARLPMRALSRTWQMLLKALEEVALAPNAMMAAEMAVIRLTHAADLPDPESLIRRLQAAPVSGPSPVQSPSAPPSGPRASAPSAPRGPVAALAAEPQALAGLQTFAQVLDLIREARDVAFLVDVETHVRLVRYSPGRIEFEPAPGAPAELAARLAHRLQTWTGVRWGVSVVGSGGAPTVAETRAEDRRRAFGDVATLPLVQAVLAAFPGAEIVEVRAPDRPAPAPDYIEVPEDWDPFDND
jgi:DNA polymerase-3 subunit gamma/tau